jgi:deazaflavin-dependent oxidoreductase (nitroreductase family)
LLRSPLHGVVSHLFVLISFTGRKSGKTYTTPVQYAQQGNTLYIITSMGYIWWKNLQDGAAVQVRLRGKDRAGTATTTTDKSTVETLLQLIYPGLKPETRQKFVQGKVAITIQLATTPDT